MKNKIIAVICILTILSGILLVGCSKKEPTASKETIGIIGAMDVEVTSLKEAAKITKTTKIAEMEFCEGTLGGKKVVIVKCGMGKVNAGICANTLINDFNCTEIINTGVAGSLDNQINIGDIIVSTDAVQHDYDVEAIGYKKGEIPYTGLYAFPADEAMRAAAVEAVRESSPDIHVFEGRVCSGDQFISTKEQKEKIISDFGGMCCEMEGAAIAQACYLNNTPFVVIRAISDKPDETDIVDYKTFEAGAAARCAKIVQYMVENIENTSNPKEVQQTMPNIQIETVKTDSFSMDYFQFGKGEKTLVILPGISVQSVMGSADAVAEAYQSLTNDFTIYLFDRRKELPASYFVYDMSKDMTEVFHALELDDIYLFGVSQGGMIAMDIAIENPELIHKLVLASTSSCITEEQFQTISEWLALAKAGDKEGLYLSFGEAVYPKELFEQSENLLIEAAKTVTDHDLERFMILAEGLKNFDVTEDLNKISCPLLLIGSKDDQVLGADAIEVITKQFKERSNFELYMYDGYGHAVYDTAPDFKERILQFFVSE